MIRLAKRSGILFILSAPSGAGKTTLTNGLRAHYPDIKLSVSCTTRARRNGEIDGRDYRFVSEERFSTMRARGEFAEWAQVHDHFYGTPRAPLDRCLKCGQDMLLDIDVPFEPDPQRCFPDEEDRRKCMKIWHGALERRHLPYARIRGDWVAREAAAIAAVSSVLRG